MRESGIICCSRGHCLLFLTRRLLPLRFSLRVVSRHFHPSIAEFQFVLSDGTAEVQISVVDLLRRVSMSIDCRDDELVALGDCLGRRVFGNGMILFHKGSSAQSLYPIESDATGTQSTPAALSSMNQED
jgi:hypothetical protein